MTKISVLIQTHNEQSHIEKCIYSAKQLTEEILVVDMESTDETVQLAKANGAKVISFPFSHYVEPGRSFGIKNVQSEWVFILDADERMTKDLAREILSLIPTTSCSYFKVPRKNMFGGKKWLRHGGWWPDEQMRLLNVASFDTWPSQIHSTPHIKGEMGYLHTPFEHHFHGNIENMVKKTLVFENIESELLYKANRRVTTATFFRKFFGELFRRLVMKAGYLDGTVGIIESVYQAYSKTITYLILYEKKNRRTVHPLP